MREADEKLKISLSFTCFTPLDTLCLRIVGLLGSMDVYRLSPVSSVMVCLCQGHTTHSLP